MDPAFDSSRNREPRPNPSSIPSFIRANDKNALPQAFLAAPDDAARLIKILIHELSNLVDGSMRAVALAQRDVLQSESLNADESGAIDKHLAAARFALDQMTHLLASFVPQESGSLRAVDVTAKQATSLADLIAHAVAILSPLAETRKLRISVSCEREVDEMAPSSLASVVLNALRNAFEAVETEGTIEVRAQRISEPGQPHRVRLTIADDGCGIEPSLAQRAFDFGFTTRAGGSGIGLALCRDILDSLSGHIDLASRTPPCSPDRPGACLTIVYPIQHEPSLTLGKTG